jgi:hypothetical protein
LLTGYGFFAVKTAVLSLFLAHIRFMVRLFGVVEHTAAPNFQVIDIKRLN